MSSVLESLTRLNIFRDLSEGERIRLSDCMEVLNVPQDHALKPPADASAVSYYFVLAGKVAFAEFPSGKVPVPPKNKKKRLQPMMQAATRIRALFEEGEFFVDSHVRFARDEHGNKNELALFASLPAELARVGKAEFDRIVADAPGLRSSVEAQSEAAYYRQTLLKLEGRSELLDFYVREGFDYADAIKVIQTDKCIDCDECVRACEERHGVSRIERFGPKQGLLQFTLNCRTCEDARCIPACKFDAMGYDSSGEVLVYDNCVGCTLCAKACPHEAIRMVDLANRELGNEVDILQMVQEKDAAENRPKTIVAKGEEKVKKKKKPKRIANKCDHCFGYNDMACISACPTGAIIQIDPRSLFRRDGGLIERADEYFGPEPFEEGWSTLQTTRGDKTILAILGAIVLACAFFIYEYLAWKMFPELSLSRVVFGSEGPLQFSAASGFGRWMGYLGAGLMILSAAYSARLNIPALRKTGSAKSWFLFHIVLGSCGPIFALLHTNFRIFRFIERPAVTLLWWFIFLVVLFGVLGRYVYTLVPKLSTSFEKEKESLDRDVGEAADRWTELTQSRNVLAQFQKAQERSEKSADLANPALVFFRLVEIEWARIRALLKLRFSTLKDMRNKELRQLTLRLMGRRSAIQKRAELLGAAKQLLALWRALHIGFTVVMFAFLIYHVTVSVLALGW